MSIGSQEAEAKKAFGRQADFQIVEILTEAFSAKAPGRPIFNAMIDRIERGEADGIISWHPDRLARNSVDGGRLIYLLDQNVLKDLKFVTFAFDNTSQGKLMLSVLFGFSKYYVDSLSENVKRGTRAKIERGWFPSTAPIGYKNDRETKTIVRDAVHFPLVKRLLELALTGTYSAPELCALARDEWHYLTPKWKRQGGKPLAMSTLYRTLANPFYAGYFYWNGTLYKGKHETMISLEEHEWLQQLIGRRGVKRPSRHNFPYTGFMRCGKCGLRITAERHTNRFGSQYVYYHCTKKALERCKQPSIEVKALEAQFVDFLRTVTIPRKFEDWILREGLPAEERSRVSAEHVRASLDLSIGELRQQLSILTDMRVRNYIPEEEFVARRKKLELEIKTAEERLDRASDGEAWFEPLASMISFSKYAVPWLLSGDEETKRMIIQTVGSNPTLLNKRLSIYKARPFVTLSDRDETFSWSARLTEVRKLITERDPETMAVLQSIKLLVKRKRLILPPLGSHLKSRHYSSPPEADVGTVDTY